MRRHGLVAVVSVLAVAAAGCSSGGGSHHAAKGTASSATGRSRSSSDAPAAKWTTASLPLHKLQPGTAGEVDGGLAATAKLPAVLVGTAMPTGGKNRALAWTSRTGASWGKGRALPVPANSSVGSAQAVGTTSYVWGSTWKDGEDTPWVLSSTDRRSWTKVALPGSFAKTGALVGAITAGKGGAIVLGLDAKHRLLAQGLDTGTLVTLPAAPYGGRYTGVAGAATRGSTVLVLANAGQPTGKSRSIGLLSTDGGATWKRVGNPAGAGANVQGVVAVGKEFVATGSTDASISKAAAWSSTNGAAWRRESTPALPNQESGWDTSLGTPIVQGGTVYAGGNDSAWLTGSVLARTGGRWHVLGSTDQWRSPNATTDVVPVSNGVAVVRSDAGQVQLGLQRGSSFHSVRFPLGASQATGWWSTPGSLSGAPVLGYDRELVTATGNGGWSEDYPETTLGFTGAAAVGVHELQPKKARSLGQTQTLSAADGSSIVVGTVVHVSSSTGDDTDIAGYGRAKSGAWKRLTGLAGPRTEQINSLYRVGSTWVVLGYDRADYNGSAHEYGAVWTSTDGLHFTRQQGPFDSDTKDDSELDGACAAPDGRLVVVGGLDDPARGEVPLMFVRTGHSWEQHPLAGLGTSVNGLYNCVDVGRTTVLQGQTPTGVGLWTTTDLKKFTRVQVGGRDDTVDSVRAVPGGLAAAGTLSTAPVYQPVVWLSKDAHTWVPVRVPTTRPAYGSDLVAWGDRLVVLLDGDGGPAVQVLENVRAQLGAIKAS